jgi:hypothetical protein
LLQSALNPAKFRRMVVSKRNKGLEILGLVCKRSERRLPKGDHPKKWVLSCSYTAGGWGGKPFVLERMLGSRSNSTFVANRESLVTLLAFTVSAGGGFAGMVEIVHCGLVLKNCSAFGGGVWRSRRRLVPLLHAAWAGPA